MFTDIGIDLGTDRTTIIRGKSVVLSEPSVVIMDDYSDQPYKIGSEAYQAIGRVSDKYRAVCPIERGVIADYNVAEHMLRSFMTTVCGQKMTKPRVMIAIPSGVTTMSQRAIINAVQNAGGRAVCPIEAPVAAAMGMGIDFTKPRGSIIVDIGAGTTDVAVMSMGGLSKCESAPVAGNDIDDAIIRHIKKEYNLLIGRHTARDIKHQIGTAVMRDVEVAMQAKGLDLSTGLPGMTEVTANEICEAISEETEQICAAIQAVLNKTPPELVGDIAADGIYACGGTMMLSGMRELLSERLGIKINMPANPLGCVVKGLGVALRQMGIMGNRGYQFHTTRDLIIE
ncbi:MAG: rod shape-determining protein [Firmicutes bacterium]|nr:rod shape-determining protein [Bacillota bacterium]